MKKYRKKIQECISEFRNEKMMSTMRKLPLIILILSISKAYPQTICEGRQIVPTVTFNQCGYDPWVLCFEDNFDGNSLDLSK